MKYALIVLREGRRSLRGEGYPAVVDAFLSGGVELSEIVLCSLSDGRAIASTVTRLKGEYDGVFLTCAEERLGYASDLLSASGIVLSGGLCEGECLFALIPATATGVKAVSLEVVPAIDRQRKKRYSQIVIRAVMPPPERVEGLIAQAKRMSGGSLSFSVWDEFGDTRIEIVYDSETPKMLADDVTRLFVSALDEYVYAVDDTPLAQRVCDALSLHRLVLSTAESFTGGSVGREIVSVPGASKVFYEGLNTYANESKIERTGVSLLTLKGEGAVSDSVAYEMAAGLIGQGHCDVAVSTTGIAGPKSDDTNKPVGLCYIAVGTKERVRVYRFHLEGDREKITQTAKNLALFLVYKEIK